ncbi:hypothetical protein [Thiomicrorhabdus chilensis]|uniref:hypothetical protein n=1 Tax=Thiomicrorhabdus chilensis TaxID=63656 RepID=UPI0004101969|nr:hypothetical protein [Thiomicrorhabdus chilensis]
MDLSKIIPNRVEDFFLNPDGSMEKYDNFKVLAHTVDSVRQFYDVFLDEKLLQQIHGISIVEINGVEFKRSRIGSKSQYQFSLQSSQLGIQALFKRFRRSINDTESQVKFELSPHFLILPISEQKKWLDGVLSYLSFLDWTPVHYALHFAIDFQVNEPGYDYVNDVFPDFASRMKGFRSSRGYQNESLSFDFKDFELTANGSKGQETITLGAPDSFQFSIYRKDLEILKSKKVEHFKSIWGYDYQEENPVFRLELRLHQSQLEKFHHQTGKHYFEFLEKDSFSIMRHFMSDRLRYMDSTKNKMAPIWWLLFESVDHKEPVFVTKPRKDKENIQHNATLALGNLVSASLKMGLGPEQITEDLLGMQSFRYLLKEKFDHVHRTDLSDSDLRIAVLEYCRKSFEKFHEERI